MIPSNTALYNIKGKFSGNIDEFNEYINEEVKFYQNQAEPNQHQIRRMNPGKLSKITEKYFPTWG